MFSACKDWQKGRRGGRRGATYRIDGSHVGHAGSEVDGGGRRGGLGVDVVPGAGIHDAGRERPLLAGDVGGEGVGGPDTFGQEQEGARRDAARVAGALVGRDVGEVVGDAGYKEQLLLLPASFHSSSSSNCFAIGALLVFVFACVYTCVFVCISLCVFACVEQRGGSDQLTGVQVLLVAQGLPLGASLVSVN